MSRYTDAMESIVMPSTRDESLPAIVEDKRSNLGTESFEPTRPYEHEGIAFFAPKVFERCSIKNSTRKDFKNSELINVSGKGAQFDSFDFRYASLEDCYFHGAHFENCNFTGAKIRRCNFRTATFQNCRFEYITIDETPIDYKQIIKQLPARPNVAQEIIQSLRRNSVTLGEAKEVRQLTLLEVEQEREHLKRARKRQEAYYVKKYGSLSDQLNVRFRSLCLWASSKVWGHGEKLSNLIISCLISVLILSFIAVIAQVHQNPATTVSSAWALLWVHMKANILEVLGASSTEVKNQSVYIIAALSVLKITFGGMFVAYIFRAVSRR
ncbi:pentapeptide repeat-containing protein [Maricaulis maris]|uniref:pentapeptide repeat-containing protein n=1 Tax=Maricaulis maris TaxID=74318 RepID=UPI003A92891E